MTQNSGFDRTDVARCWAGFASLGAGLIHLAVVREHAAQWWVFGMFFAALGVLQILWALAAWARENAPARRTMIGLTLGVIALWALTRTTGLPVGPAAGAAERVGRADLLAVVLEACVVLTLVAAGRRHAASTTAPSPSAMRYVALLGAGALAVSAITTPALAATESGAHSHGHFASDEDR